MQKYSSLYISGQEDRERGEYSSAGIAQHQHSSMLPLPGRDSALNQHHMAASPLSQVLPAKTQLKQLLTPLQFLCIWGLMLGLKPGYHTAAVLFTRTATKDYYSSDFIQSVQSLQTQQTCHSSLDQYRFKQHQKDPENSFCK